MAQKTLSSTWKGFKTVTPPALVGLGGMLVGLRLWSGRSDLKDLEYLEKLRKHVDIKIQGELPDKAPSEEVVDTQAQKASEQWLDRKIFLKPGEKVIDFANPIPSYLISYFSSDSVNHLDFQAMKSLNKAISNYNNAVAAYKKAKEIPDQLCNDHGFEEDRYEKCHDYKSNQIIVKKIRYFRAISRIDGCARDYAVQVTATQLTLPGDANFPGAGAKEKLLRLIDALLEKKRKVIVGIAPEWKLSTFFISAGAALYWLFS